VRVRLRVLMGEGVLGTDFVGVESWKVVGMRMGMGIMGLF
jgi:hypothetical protein